MALIADRNRLDRGCGSAGSGDLYSLAEKANRRCKNEESLALARSLLENIF